MAEENSRAPEAHEQPAAIPTPRVGREFLLASLFLALVKLWMVGGDEVVARYQPHDDLWYLTSAKQWYWLGAYTQGTFGTPPFIRLPAYPLFIALTRLTGVPLRVSIELLLIVAALAFAASVIKAGQSRTLALLLYAAIVFHPASIHVNNRALPDSLYAPVLLLSLACMILLFLKRDHPRRLRYGLLAGAALAALWQVRQESVIIIGLLAAYGLILLFAAGVRGRPRAALTRQVGAALLAPALVILAVSLALRTVNYYKFGVFAPDAISTPGFEAACKALLRIKPSPPIHYVPVPREVRLRAYAVSPAFRELEPYFEGEPGHMWQGFAKSMGVEVEGEISAAHIWWAFNDAAYKAGYNRSGREADEFFRRVADEVNAACDGGRLQCRWAFSSVLDPDVGNYAPYLPSSLRRIAAIFFDAYGPAGERDALNLDPEVGEVFDEMANRRRTLSTSDWVTHLSGWAFAPGDELQRVDVRDGTGRVVASTERFTARPDVAAAYTARGAEVPLLTGYYIRFPSSETYDASLVFLSWKGKEWVVPHVRSLSGLNSEGALTYAVEADETFRYKNASRLHRLAYGLEAFLGAQYRKATLILTLLGAASLAVLLLRRRRVELRGSVYTIIMLSAAAILIRVMLFALVDASSYRATDVRYLYPVLPLYDCTLLLLTAQALRLAAPRLDYHRLLRRLDFRRARGGATPAAGPESAPAGRD